MQCILTVLGFMKQNLESLVFVMVICPNSAYLALVGRPLGFVCLSDSL